MLSSSSSSPSSSARFGPLPLPRLPKLITVFLRCSSSNCSSSFGFGLTLEGAGPAKLKVIDGGIAHRNGLKSNDELLAIDRESVAELGHLEVVVKMRKVMRRRCEAWLTVRRCPSSSPGSPSSSPAGPPRRRLPFHRLPLPFRRSDRYKKCRLFSPPPSVFLQKCADSMPSGPIWDGRNSPKFRPRRSLNSASTNADIPSPLSPISNVSGTSPVLSPLSPPSPHLLVTQWILQYLGRFEGEHQQQKQGNYWMEEEETAQWVDKALLFFGRSSAEKDEQSELCLLNVFEDELTVHRGTAPFVVSVPYGCVRAVGRSRVDSRGFGVIIATNDATFRPHASFAVLSFRCVPRAYAQHHAAHAHFARSMGVRCRRKQLALLELSVFSASTASCVQFPFECAEVLASLRFGIPPFTTVKNRNNTGDTVEKFMAKLAEGLEIGEQFSSKEWGRTDYEGGKDEEEEDDEADNTSTTDSMNTIVEFGICEPSENGRNGQNQWQSETVERRKSFVPLPPSSSSSSVRALSPAKCQPRPMPPPLPPKPRFLTQQKAPSLSSSISLLSSFVPLSAFSSASSSVAAPNEFDGSDQQKEGAQQHYLPAHLKTTTEETEEVAASDERISEQYPQHNPDDCSKVPAVATSSVASFALSRNSENKENRRPSPSAVQLEKTKEQTQAEAARESPKRRIGHQIRHGQQQKQPKRQTDTSPQALPIGHAQRQSPEAAMPPAPGSPKQQQPDSSVDLEQVLKSEAARAPFHQFLQQQFCAENINFYLAVEEYKKIPENEFGRRTDFGRQIFDRHFAANCIEPVNIDNSTSNQIREAYKNNRFTSDVYDVVQYQIFHLLKYDCWPRYLRGGGQLAEELGGDAKSHDSGASTSQFAEPKPDFPIRFCTLLCADSATSTEIALSDPFQSVKQWTNAMAEGCGLDKHASEVVDAQTGSTIDPVRQAVDALNNRVVRIIPVVKMPVLFLAPSSPCVGAKPSSPMAAKVVILRCRPALTVGKVLRPIMAKYNVDSEQAVVCIAGTCEVLKLQTPVNAVYLKTLAVMSQQQFAERKVMPKREYQKELTMVPSWMICASTTTTAASSSSTSAASGQSSPGPDSHLPPFHQHGDVGFCELPLEVESTSKLGSALLKHTATRSYSSNPREFFKFGRKPTIAKSRGGLEQQQTDANTGGAVGASVGDSAAGTSGSSGGVSQLRYRKSGGSGMGAGRSGAISKEAESRRKSLGAAAAANAIAAGTILHRDSPVGTPTGSVTGVSSSGRLSSAALAVGLVAPSDIPYCGEVEPPEEPPLEQETCSTYAVHSTLIRHEPVYGTKSAVISASTADRKGVFDSEGFSRNRSAFPSGANGAPASTASPLPAIFSSAVRSDKNGAGGGINASPSAEAMVWQKADYV
ncbi:hypothetical protein niasHT_007136 [Heterodera trifolii]|uniref:Uncharacterized protein n=1 Tax=Heterodera trifolii TaxID=157864 RepID=A0ABD2LKT5_9BILA